MNVVIKRDKWDPSTDYWPSVTVSQPKPVRRSAWSVYVDEGLRELVFSGAALLVRLVVILVMALASPLAYLGHGAKQALDALKET